MATPLRRLLPYHDRYKVAVLGRHERAAGHAYSKPTIPLFLRDGIERMPRGSYAVAAGSIDIAAARATLAWPAFAIVSCVLAEFACIIVSRRAVRRIGVRWPTICASACTTTCSIRGPGSSRGTRRAT